jgi:hypothetical protein
MVISVSFVKEEPRRRRARARAVAGLARSAYGRDLSEIAKPERVKVSDTRSHLARIFGPDFSNA